MIHSLSGQSSSALTSLLSGFTNTDRKPGDGFPIGKPKTAAAGDTDSANAVGKAAPARTADLPDGVPAAVARAFPDFSELALNIVDRASLSSAAGAARAQTESDLLNRVAGILGPAQGDEALSGKIAAAAQSFDDWSKTPEDGAKRAGAFSALQDLIGQVSSIHAGLGDLSGQIDGQIQDETQGVMDGLRKLKSANADLMIAKSDGTNTASADQARRQAMAQLADRVELRFQDRPDGSLVPLQADGTPMPETLDDLSPEAIQSGATGGRLAALIDMRDRVIPDMARRVQGLSASLGDKLNAAGVIAPAASLTGSNSGLSANDRMNLSGATVFALVDAQGAAKAAVSIDFSGRTRRTLSTPPAGLNVQTPAQLTKAVNEGLAGNGELAFKNGVFTFSSTDDRYRVQIASNDQGQATRGGRSFASVFGLGRLVDAPISEAGASGFTTGDPTGFTAGQGFAISLEAPSGQTATARITVDGKSFGDLLNQINDRETGLGTVMNLSLDRDGALVKAVAPGFMGARLSVIDDTTSRGDTGKSFSDLFGFGAQTLSLAPGVSADTIQASRAVMTDKTQRGQLLSAPTDGSAAAKISKAFQTETVIPAGPDRPARIVPIAQAAADLSADAAAQASAATAVQSDARTFALALKDERGRLSSASFGAELSHLATLQTARNIGGRLDAQATGLLAYLDRAIAAQNSVQSATALAA